MSKLFEKVFIPNRGVIAVRAIHTLRDMGIRSAVGYSDGDRLSLAVRMADEAYRLGPAPSKTSYLDAHRIVRTARDTQCDAVFPGYGFLSENPEFADLCERSGITFIGPSSSVLRRLGHKGSARQVLSEAGFTVLPGREIVRGPGDIRAFGEEVGYPLLVKPATGAGGVGTVRIDTAADIETKLEHSRAVATIALGDDSVIVEKLIDRAAAISVPFLVDQRGNAIHLGNREGSIQRGYGKLVDEAPSPKLDPETRSRMGTKMARTMSNLGYVGAGTAEFLLDSSGEMFAIEVNPRIQVEHVVTEMVVQLDIVEQMVRIAAGQPLTWKQDDVTFSRHAVQCRVKAEDPRFGFSPCHGRVTRLHVANGPFVRHDDGIYPGCDVPMYYDSMLLKICAVGEDRGTAIRRLAENLSEFSIGGVKTTVPLTRRILGHPEFLDGSYDTTFLARHLGELLAALRAESAASPVRVAIPAPTEANK